MGLVAWITVATANVSSIKIGLKNSVPSSEVQRHIKKDDTTLTIKRIGRCSFEVFGYGVRLGIDQFLSNAKG